jgi:hypothetical protein
MKGVRGKGVRLSPSQDNKSSSSLKRSAARCESEFCPKRMGMVQAARLERDRKIEPAWPPWT